MDPMGHWEAKDHWGEVVDSKAHRPETMAKAMAKVRVERHSELAGQVESEVESEREMEAVEDTKGPTARVLEYRHMCPQECWAMFGS